MKKKNTNQINKNIIKELLQLNIETAKDLMKAKRNISKKYKINLAKNSDIISELKKLPKQTDKKIVNLLLILKKRAIRTMSGIAPVAVLTKPYACPGKCAYCPTEKNVPQSYLSNEPAVMRAIHCKYDPHKQVAYRIKALEANGHEPTKIELIVIGGTWSYFPEKYKYWYIANCFASANNYGKKIKKNSPKTKTLKATSKIEDLKKWLHQEQKKNEKSTYRIIGLTLETRPDYINDKELLEMRDLGCTRVEIGVQAIDDKILKLNKRESTVQEIIDATKLLKNYSFKVTYHFMPALPGSTAKKDLQMFQDMFTPLKDIKTIKSEKFKLNKTEEKKEIKKLEQLLNKEIKNNNFNPDQIKFYPTVVTKGSLLYTWWKQGKYKPYSDKVLQNLIINCKKIIPPFVRIIRLVRDIPGDSIIAGNKITNLRQILKDKGVQCSCIRCREAKNKKFTEKQAQLFIQKYKASDSDEYFISYESKDQKILYGFTRLRLPNKNDTPKILKDSALLRELHVYGQLVSVGSGKNQTQHSGIGKKLMKQAEQIAQLAGYNKLAIISGIGVRGYYKKLGYKLKHTYLVKALTK